MDLDPFLDALFSSPAPAQEQHGPGMAQSSYSSQRDIDNAVAAARAAGSRATDVGDLLTDLPGSSQPLRVDGMHGIQFLRKRFAGFDYCARVDVPGVLPKLRIGGLFTGDGDGDFGPEVPFGPRSYRAWSRAPAAVRLFDTPDVTGALAGLHRAVIVLRPETNDRTVVEVDLPVGDARSCAPGAGLARVVVRLARAAVDTGLVFAEPVGDARPAAERVEALVSRVTAAVSWVSGPVERVGDGVEARLALEEQPDAPSVLRFDLDGAGRCAVFFEGRLIDSSERLTRLTPQESFIDRLRGLVDVKVDDAAFDDAWLIDGDPRVSKALLQHAALLLRLREKHAAVEVGPAGLVVRVPGFKDDDVGVVDVAGAVLSLWRNLCRDARGFVG